jgi:hypothetical protein
MCHQHYIITCVLLEVFLRSWLALPWDSLGGEVGYLKNSVTGVQDPLKMCPIAVCDRSNPQ